MLKAILKMLGFNPCDHQYEIIKIGEYTLTRHGVAYGEETVYTSRCKHCGLITSTTVSTKEA